MDRPSADLPTIKLDPALSGADQLAAIRSQLEEMEPLDASDFEGAEEYPDEFPSTLEPAKIKIDVTIQHLPTLNKLCWEAIEAMNGDEALHISPRLFSFGGARVWRGRV